MFFILAYSDDSGETWRDQFGVRYESGAEAAKVARDNNAYAKSSNSPYIQAQRWRVRKVLDTDSDNFLAREQAANHALVTDDIPPSQFWGDVSWSFPHYDPSDKRKMRFFRTMTDAAEGKWTTMNLSRYLSAFTNMSDEEVEKFLIKKGVYSNTYTFDITQDADRIEHIYVEGPSSCMNDPEEYPLPDPHPARVYAGPDLAVAYIEREGNITARGVVWPEKKIYYTCYGHETLLISELEKAGYRFADKDEYDSEWIGARLQDIGDDIFPYLDLSEKVDHDGTYWIIAGGDGEYFSRTCSGYIGDPEDY